MSSPSPGKRRIDTDVIKLYPCSILCRFEGEFRAFMGAICRTKMALVQQCCGCCEPVDFHLQML